MTKCPDTFRGCDIWVDFKAHAWMDTVALRPLSSVGQDYLADSSILRFKQEWRLHRRDFDDWFYDQCMDDQIKLNVEMADDR